MRVALLNASLQGEDGNCAALLRHAEQWLSESEIERCTLASDSNADVLAAIARADALVIATGTYWDSWSSRLQAFLEHATDSEGSELWLGKPVAVVVLAHSVGGKGVLSRLQGVLNTFGACMPPMGGLVLSWVGQEALRALESSGQDEARDIWRRSDLEVVIHNLREMASGSRRYRSWEVDEANRRAIWLDE